LLLLGLDIICSLEGIMILNHKEKGIKGVGGNAKVSPKVTCMAGLVEV
jgi:hypothetical protein